MGITLTIGQACRIKPIDNDFEKQMAVAIPQILLDVWLSVLLLKPMWSENKIDFKYIYLKKY